MICSPSSKIPPPPSAPHSPYPYQFTPCSLAPFRQRMIISHVVWVIRCSQYFRTTPPPPGWCGFGNTILQCGVGNTVLPILQINPPPPPPPPSPQVGWCGQYGAPNTSNQHPPPPGWCGVGNTNTSDQHPPPPPPPPPRLGVVWAIQCSQYFRQTTPSPRLGACVANTSDQHFRPTQLCSLFVYTASLEASCPFRLTH